MLLLFKSLSRTVHHYHEQHQQRQQEEEDKQTQNDIDKITHETSSISLTVWRKSLLFNCSGFTVIGPDGSLAYRVDNYTPRPFHILLMDGLGNPIFTLCRPKKLKLVKNYWLVYEGEISRNLIKSSLSKNEDQPVLRARKNRMSRANVLAHVYAHDGRRYVVEGSYVHRSCKILDDSRRATVGEIKKKRAARSSSGAASFGLEVFELVVRQGFDPNFAMAIVLLLDQM